MARDDGGRPRTAHGGGGSATPSSEGSAAGAAPKSYRAGAMSARPRLQTGGYGLRYVTGRTRVREIFQMLMEGLDTVTLAMKRRMGKVPLPSDDLLQSQENEPLDDLTVSQFCTLLGELQSLVLGDSPAEDELGKQASKLPHRRRQKLLIVLDFWGHTVLSDFIGTLASSIRSVGQMKRVRQRSVPLVDTATDSGSWVGSRPSTARSWRADSARSLTPGRPGTANTVPGGERGRAGARVRIASAPPGVRGSQDAPGGGILKDGAASRPPNALSRFQKGTKRLVAFNRLFSGKSSNLTHSERDLMRAEEARERNKITSLSALAAGAGELRQAQADAAREKRQSAKEAQQAEQMRRMGMAPAKEDVRAGSGLVTQFYDQLVPDWVTLGSRVHGAGGAHVDEEAAAGDGGPGGEGDPRAAARERAQYFGSLSSMVGLEAPNAKALGTEPPLTAAQKRQRLGKARGPGGAAHGKQSRAMSRSLGVSVKEGYDDDGKPRHRDVTALMAPLGSLDYAIEHMDDHREEHHMVRDIAVAMGVEEMREAQASAIEDAQMEVMNRSLAKSLGLDLEGLERSLESPRQPALARALSRSSSRGRSAPGGGHMPYAPQRTPPNKAMAMKHFQRISTLRTIRAQHHRDGHLVSRRIAVAAEAADAPSGRSTPHTEDDSIPSTRPSEESVGWVAADLPSSPGRSRGQRQAPGNEMLLAYTEGCARLGTPLVSSVVRGLQALDPRTAEDSTDLELRLLQIGPTGIRPLFDALRLHGAVGLTHLGLAGNDLGPPEVVELVDVLLRNEGMRLESLDLSGNRMQGAGAAAVAKLLRAGHHVKEGTDPSRAIARRQVPLATLRLAGCNIGDKPLAGVIQALQGNACLTALDLSRNRGMDAAAHALGAALQQNLGLRRLDVSWNHLRGEHMGALADGLSIHPGVEELVLSWNGLGPKGVFALAPWLARDEHVRRLALVHCDIPDGCCRSLAEALVENASLQNLDLGGNPLTATGAADLLRAVERRPGARLGLSLTGCALNLEGIDGSVSGRLPWDEAALDPPPKPPPSKQEREAVRRRRQPEEGSDEEDGPPPLPPGDPGLAWVSQGMREPDGSAIRLSSRLSAVNRASRKHSRVLSRPPLGPGGALQGPRVGLAERLLTNNPVRAPARPAAFKAHLDQMADPSMLDGERLGIMRIYVEHTSYNLPQAQALLETFAIEGEEHAKAAVLLGRAMTIPAHARVLVTLLHPTYQAIVREALGIPAPPPEAEAEEAEVAGLGEEALLSTATALAAWMETGGTGAMDWEGEGGGPGEAGAGSGEGEEALGPVAEAGEKAGDAVEATPVQEEDSGPKLVWGLGVDPLAGMPQPTAESVSSDEEVQDPGEGGEVAEPVGEAGAAAGSPPPPLAAEDAALEGRASLGSRTEPQ